MSTKELWEEFEKTYLVNGDERPQNSKHHDKQLNKIDVMNSFSIYINYHSNVCINLMKDTQLTSYFWRDLNNRKDIKSLYINELKLYELL